MSSDGPRPACFDRIKPDEFEPATPIDIEENEPCRYCFPDHEIDVADEDLLVASTWRRFRRSVHRHERTGDLDYEQDNTRGKSLASAIRDNDGDLEAPDVQELLGGGA